MCIPGTVAILLSERRETQSKIKNLFGADYKDYDLVIILDNGNPLEGAILLNRYKCILEPLGYEEIDFHLLRHSSTTYKLIINKGDIKATQGDTGHAEADMVTSIYAPILDENRKIGATVLDREFYQNSGLWRVRGNLSSISDDSGNSDSGIPKLDKLLDAIQENP